MTVRDALPADDDAVAHIAALGDAHTPPPYLAYVRAAGRLLAATGGDGTVLGFGGMVPVPNGVPVAMVTDLFVHPDARGHGVGTLLLQHLLDGHPRRMTCSSSHPAALPAYVRAGMEPRRAVRYWRGPAVGGGPPLASGAWAHDRLDLVAGWASQGAVVTADAVVDVRDGGRAVVYRLVSAAPERDVDGILHALPAGTEVTLCVPDWQPLGAWLHARGFVAADHDTWCASPGVEPDPLLAVVHPGLW